MSYDNVLLITDILTIACGALVGILIYASHKNQYMSSPSVAILKTLLGADIILVAFISWYLLKNFSIRSDIFFNFQLFIIVAIVIQIISEYFSYNIGLNESRFKVSLVLSLISLIAFFIVECVKNLNNLIAYWIPITVIIVLLVILLQLTVNKKAYLPDGGSKKLYFTETVALSALLSESITEVIKDKSYNTLLFMIGAALLFLTYIFTRLWGGASDRENFANARLITFYGGLIVIALSISPFYLDYFAN